MTANPPEPFIDSSPHFPILDSDRTEANDELNRFVVEGFGYIAPHIDEIDSWCSMGVRLAHNDAAGWVIELGPYDLDATDIHALRRAIAAYDQATGRRTR